MDLVESSFNWEVVIEEWGTEVLRKIRPPHILWEPFKDSTLPRAAVGY